MVAESKNIPEYADDELESEEIAMAASGNAEELASLKRDIERKRKGKETEAEAGKNSWCYPIFTCGGKKE